MARCVSGRATRFGHKSHIVRRLSYRLQELAYGVDLQIENRIEQQANDLLGSGTSSKPKRKIQYRRPIPSTKLVREYKGIEYIKASNIRSPF
ncbi:DUF2924 domain-containing protein [Bartonella sp. CM100XJJH]|uniref:DUF2924 domain-containing protein n=1 Tax=Bartonella sp. CM100XJJH TaxID=3243543 RepID=UPI0035CF4C21